MADVWANSKACHPRATYHIAGCCHLVNSLSWFQSHMPHCRVQSPDEINVVIVPHSIRHIENRFSPYFIFVFYRSLGFVERRLSYCLRYTCFIHNALCTHFDQILKYVLQYLCPENFINLYFIIIHLWLAFCFKLNVFSLLMMTA